MRTKMKGKAIIGIVEFEDQGYTVRITFPNGEGIAYNGSKNMWLDYRDSRKTNKEV
jgi:hypothetical protein